MTDRQADHDLQMNRQKGFLFTILHVSKNIRMRCVVANKCLPVARHAAVMKITHVVKLTKLGIFLSDENLMYGLQSR